MKKFSLIPSTVLLAAVVVVFFIACQKEQSAATEEQVVPASEGAVKGIAGTGHYAGSINQSYAASLAANYIRKYGDDDDQTQSVAFSADDLIAYINGLKTKYKSDIIYVNFGVYGKGALPLNGKGWGRLTVFFTGNKMSTTSSGRKIDGTANDEVSDDFLNHGGLVPPPNQ